MEETAVVATARARPNRKADGMTSEAEIPKVSFWGRWKEHLGLALLFGLAFLLFELTARPAMAVILAAFKFGWNDFRTAFWIRGRDPHRDRGVALFWYSIALGLWKVTVVSILLSICILAIARRAPRPAIKIFRGGSLTAGMGLVLLTFVPILGAIRARRSGVRVWVNGGLTHARRNQYWPPIGHGVNSARGLLLASLILPALVTATVARRTNAPAVALLIATEGLLLWLISRGTLARHPEECWPELSHGDAVEMPTDSESELTVMEFIEPPVAPEKRPIARLTPDYKPAWGQQ